MPVTAEKLYFYYPGFGVSKKENSTSSKYSQNQNLSRKVLREIQRAEF